jgi:hypothetical protein
MSLCGPPQCFFSLRGNVRVTLRRSGIARQAVLTTALHAGAHLPYEGELRHYFGLEVTLVFVMFVCELARLFVGSRGNKLEQVALG